MDNKSKKISLMLDTINSESDDDSCYFDECVEDIDEVTNNDNQLYKELNVPLNKNINFSFMDNDEDKNIYKSNTTLDELIINATEEAGMNPIINGCSWFDTLEELKLNIRGSYKFPVKYTLYKFCAFDSKTKFIKELKIMPDRYKMFHEILLDNKQQKMFCDIDADYIKYKKTDILKIFHALIDQMFQKFNMGEFDINKTKITMSRGSKISFHWIYNDDKVFKNYKDQLIFWSYIYKIIEKDYKELCFTHENSDHIKEERTIIDLAPYGKNRSMRIIDCHKQSDSMRVLDPIKFYDDTDNERINVLPLCAVKLSEYFITTNIKKYYDISEIPKIKIKINDHYKNSDKTEIYDLLEKSEYGFSEICLKKFNNVKLYNIKLNDVYIWNNNTKLWEFKDISFLYKKIINLLEPLLNDWIDDLTRIFNNLTEKNHKKMMMKKIQQASGLKSSIYKNRTITAIIKFMKPELYDEKFINKINKSMYNLPIKNGKIINLRTKDVRDRTIKDLFSFECPVEYNEYEKYTNVEKLINPIFLNNSKLINYFRRNMGMCLTESMVNRELMIFHGNGANGKSCLMKCVQLIMHDYFATASKDVFISSKLGNSTGSATPHLKTLVNRRLVTISELNNSEKLNSVLIKSITGGDSIKYRALYEDEKQFDPTCKLVILCNTAPIFDSSDKAMLDRLAFYPFQANFVNKHEVDKLGDNEFFSDPDFIDEFQKNHINEFFSWLVEGSYLYFNDKKGNIKPKCVNDALSNILDEVDIIQEFIEMKCDTTENSYITTSELYKSFHNYCTHDKFLTPDKIDTSNIFTRKIKKKGYIKKVKRCGSSKKTQQCFIGIELTKIILRGQIQVNM